MATKRLTYTVTIQGEVIARFGMADDAAFFARKANEAGLFELTNPGAEALAYDSRGNLIEPDRYTSK